MVVLIPEAIIKEAAGPTVDAAAALPEKRGGFGALFRATSKVPSMFVRHPVAQIGNRGLDAVTKKKGVAKECEVGESVALCIDALGGGDGGGSTPFGFLLGAGLEFAGRVTYEPRRE